jgi:hypothetical protein
MAVATIAAPAIDVALAGFALNSLTGYRSYLSPQTT